MEKNFSDAVGKSRGEVIRDINEFLATPYWINRQKRLDLCRLVPDLNMHRQLAFGLLSEMKLQGWETNEAEHFFRLCCAPALGEDEAAKMLAVFEAPDSETYALSEKLYGNRFGLLDGSYWATVLALGLDAGEIDRSMEYLRLFTVTLMEVAYMENRNPSSTYTWGYYESFVKMLDALVAEPEPLPEKLRVRAIGGTAGKRQGNAYMLSLGVDVENPDPVHTAKQIDLDITLTDGDGNTITVIRDRLSAISPKTVFHYGVTRRISGPAVAKFSAGVKAAKYAKETAPPPHVTLTHAKYGHGEGETAFEACVTPHSEQPYSALCLHYQFRNEAGKIAGGGNEWFYIPSGEGSAPLSLSSTLPLDIKTAAKVICSADFDTV